MFAPLREEGHAEDALQSILQGLSALIPPLPLQIVSLLTCQVLQPYAHATVVSCHVKQTFIVGMLRPGIRHHSWKRSSKLRCKSISSTAMQKKELLLRKAKKEDKHHSHTSGGPKGDGRRDEERIGGQMEQVCGNDAETLGDV